MILWKLYEGRPQGQTRHTFTNDGIAMVLVKTRDVNGSASIAADAHPERWRGGIETIMMNPAR
jgi:hypothetical protein